MPERRNRVWMAKSSQFLVVHDGKSVEAPRLVSVRYPSRPVQPAL